MKLKMLFWLAPLVLVSCAPGPKSGRGFSLPDGEAEAGRVVFTQLGCVGCHTVEGTELTEVAGAIHVRLGGKVLRVRTYGELVTAVINPSHDIAKGYPAEAVSREGESLMADYSETMTVRQLIDVVAFLQSAYQEYLPDDYDPYFP